MATGLIENRHDLGIEAAPLAGGQRNHASMNVCGESEYQPLFVIHRLGRHASGACFGLAGGFPISKAEIADVFHSVPAVVCGAAAMAQRRFGEFNIDASFEGGRESGDALVACDTERIAVKPDAALAVTGLRAAVGVNFECFGEMDNGKGSCLHA